MSARRLLLALVASTALTAGTVACSSDSDGGAKEGATTTAVDGTTTTAKGDKGSTGERPDGPAATVDKELTEGSMFLVSPQAIDLEAAGYEETEYQVSGTAVSYEGDTPETGKWSLKETGTTGDFATRVVVRRPTDTTKANGTVLIEWLNVSGGIDAPASFVYTHEELLREGYTWIGVSAQFIGVEGGPTAVSLPGLDDMTGKGLKAMDPARYGELSHPGDEFAYDIFTQIGRTVREAPEDLIGDITPKNVLAAGESQSAFALTTYVDGVQPLTKTFDGFFLHSRGGPPLPLAPPAGSKSADIASSISGLPTLIRDDVDVPVFMFEAETDVEGLLGYSKARQDDAENIHTWEVAGTAHVDATMLGPVAGIAECNPAVNNGPHALVVKAALHSLHEWVANGTTPKTAPRLELDADGKAVRDENGIIEGGIRTPLVDVPVDALRGDAAPEASIFCMLAGQTVPLEDSVLAKMYRGADDYETKYEASADETIEAGWVLEADREAMMNMAQPDRVKT